MQKEKQYEFWIDKIARDVVERKKFHYTDEKIPKFKEFVVKTSASLSGVLHIGRLSDTIRGEAVYRGLKDAGVKAKIIWVAEDMDPLRKIPEGVPKKFEEYLGAPVSDIPDPHGCHESYAKHFMDEYMQVINNFVGDKLETHTMRWHYKNGDFSTYIKKIIERTEEIKKIQDKHREESLPADWTAWKPICDNCGKIITPKITGIDDGKVSYVCQDYDFEKTLAKGCGHKGVNDPMKGNGKLLWKSEWAMQWAHWKVCAEGAGKEYQVPGSAFWINAEIVEKILKFPMPVPIFYEHLTIDGKKMSASLGNIVYPHEWLEMATPEMLRMLFLKDPMRVRDFRWSDVPALSNEHDTLEKIYFGKKKIGDKRDKFNLKRLYELTLTKPIAKKFEEKVPLDVMSEIAKILPEKNQLKFTVEKLKELGHIKKVDLKTKSMVEEKLEHAKKWIEKTEKKEKVKVEISEEEKIALEELIEGMEKIKDGEELQTRIFEVAKENKIKPISFFRLIYKILLNSERGPRLGPYILERGKEEVVRKLKEVL